MRWLREIKAEQKLKDIWQELLPEKEISVFDNFFTIGGNSLLAVRLLSSIKKFFEVELSIIDIFEKTSIAEQAELIQNDEQKISLPSIPKRQSSGPIPLSFAQERLWFIDKLKGTSHYHIPSLLRLKGDLNIALLEDALRTIVERHEVLRTVYSLSDGKAHQEVISSEAWCIDYIEKGSEQERLEDYAKTLVMQAFDLEKDYMLRAHLIKVAAEEHALILVRHHIASDGWSTSIIIDELKELYLAAQEHRKANLKSLPIQYADYASWQRAHFTPSYLDDKLNYWEKKLAGLERLNLPLDFPRPKEQAIHGDTIHFQLDKKLSRALGDLAKEEGVTLFMLLLTVYKILLSRYSNQTDICVGTTIANRPLERSRRPHWFLCQWPWL